MSGNYNPILTSPINLNKNIHLPTRFLHLELEFADSFEDRGEFDLVLGNPPWIKAKWKKGGALGDVEPKFVLRKYSASRLNELQAFILKQLDEAICISHG